MSYTLDNTISLHLGIKDLINQYGSEFDLDSSNDNSYSFTSGGLQLNIPQDEWKMKNLALKPTNEIIHLVDEWRKMREDLVSIKAEQNMNILFGLSSNVTHAHSNDKFKTWCEELLEHHKSLVANMNLFVWCLQQCIEPGFFAIHRLYHKELRSLIDDLVNIVADVKLFAECIEIRGASSLKLNEGLLLLTDLISVMENTLKRIITLKVAADKSEASDGAP